MKEGPRNKSVHRVLFRGKFLETTLYMLLVINDISHMILLFIRRSEKTFVLNGHTPANCMLLSLRKRGETNLGGLVGITLN